MSDLEDRVKRIEEIAGMAYKLAKLVRRRHNKNTKIFSANFEVFDEEVKRNSANIDKIVNTLQELMGEVEIKNAPENSECKRYYL